MFKVFCHNKPRMPNRYHTLGLTEDSRTTDHAWKYNCIQSGCTTECTTKNATFYTYLIRALLKSYCPSVYTHIGHMKANVVLLPHWFNISSVRGTQGVCTHESHPEHSMQSVSWHSWAQTEQGFCATLTFLRCGGISKLELVVE